MKNIDNKLLIISAILLASTSFSASSSAASKTTDPVGKCYGVVGAHEGECGGKDPVTGKSWGCAGENPTADLGWKQMKKSACDALSKHAEATEKKFVANK